MMLLATPDLGAGCLGEAVVGEAEKAVKAAEQC